MRARIPIASLLVAAALMMAAACTLAPPPTAAPRSTPTPTEIPTQSVTPAPTEAPTATAPARVTPVATDLSAPTAVPAPTEAPTSTAAHTRAERATPPPRETATPTFTPAPTVTPLPTRTPLPTLSPEAVAATEALLPDWVEDRSDLTSFLLDLKRNWPAASALFESLEWVRDGIGNSPSGRDTLEVDFVSGLKDSWALGPTGQEISIRLMGKSWMQDKISREESLVAGSLWRLFRTNSTASMHLIQLPFLDSVDGAHELRTIGLVGHMLYDDRGALQRLLSSQEFAGGITDDHVTALELINSERFDPEAVAAIRGLPWVQDGTDASDWEEVNALIRLARNSHVFFRAAMDSLGVQDGISPEELTVIQSLYGAGSWPWQDYDSAVTAIEALPWIQDGVHGSEWDGAVALLRLGDLDFTTFWSTIRLDWVQDGISEDEIEMIASLS